MAQKKGAGNKPQEYDEKNGQYTGEGSGSAGNGDGGSTKTTSDGFGGPRKITPAEEANLKNRGIYTDETKKSGTPEERRLIELGIEEDKNVFEETKETFIPQQILDYCAQISEEEIKASSGWLSGLGKQDDVLKELITIRGFDEKPKTVSDEEIQKFVSEGYLGFTRGMKVDYGAEQYKTGEMYVGRGVHGHGVYVSCYTSETSERALLEAEKYAKSMSGGKGSVIVGAIDKSAKVITKSQLNSIREKLSDSWTDREKMIFRDNGKLAVALGYDVINCENDLYYIVLNRGKTIVGG